ncbi:MAG: PAS domain-containing protein [Proteobacteria bacterium]|nr:PAS domain-containing protein [Pseudomonadota bacterium]
MTITIELDYENTGGDDQLRGAIDTISNSLCQAVDGDLDFCIDSTSGDKSVRKLEVLINFILKAARETINRLKTKAHDLDMKIAASQKESAQFNQILSNMPEGICVIDMQHRILHSNNKLPNCRATEDGDLKGKLCYEVLQLPICQTDECPIRRIEAGESRVDVELITKDSLGGSKSCNLSAVPFRNPQGELTGIIDIFNDI